MRIGRTGAGVVFGSTDRAGWTSSAALGVAPDCCIGDLVPQLPRIAERLAQTAPDVAADTALNAPVTRPGKILAVGLNYLAHIAEVGKPRPEVPMIFAKYPSAVTGPRDRIILNPAVTSEVDYETELAVVIGSPARAVSRQDALRHVLGYCVANDVSARDIQRRESQISRSKSLDSFCPIGPWVTTVDDVPHPDQLTVRTTVNGEVRQSSTTADMLFGVAFLVEYLSRTTTLEPGDILLTGTPSGVGSRMTPPTYLQEGDIVCCEISGLGRLENRVSAS